MVEMSNGAKADPEWLEHEVATNQTERSSLLGLIPSPHIGRAVPPPVAYLPLVMPPVGTLCTLHLAIKDKREGRGDDEREYSMA